MTTLTTNWLNEQDLLGYSGAMVYRNFCAGCGNIIVGGTNFLESAANFQLSLAFLNEDGTTDTDSTFLINQSSFIGDHTDPTNAPYIDHMHLDSSTGEDWLFGTTRSILRSSYGT